MTSYLARKRLLLLPSCTKRTMWPFQTTVEVVELCKIPQRREFVFEGLRPLSHSTASANLVSSMKKTPSAFLHSRAVPNGSKSRRITYAGTESSYATVVQARRVAWARPGYTTFVGVSCSLYSIGKKICEKRCPSKFNT